MKTNIHSLIISRSLLRMRKVSDKFVEKIRTHILYSVTFFSFENRPIYGIMWRNILRRGKQHTTIWRIRIACWIPKASHTYAHSEYVIRIAFPLQQWLCERVSVSRYTFIACLVLLHKFVRTPAVFCKKFLYLFQVHLI
jgi:hypothetical protein